MADEHTIITIAPKTEADRKRKRKELIIGVFAFLLVVGLTTLTLSLVGVESVMFFVLLNINILLLALVLFLVIRNGIKLLLERRRGVLGSRLRTRLVVTFMLLSLIPTTMMFIASTRAVQSSVDYWFRNRVDSYIQMALSVGAQYVDSVSGFLQTQCLSMQEHLQAGKISPASEEMTHFIDRRKHELPYALIGLAMADGTTLNWNFKGDAQQAWDEAKTRINWNDWLNGNTYRSIFQPGQDGDYVFGLQPLPRLGSAETPGFLVLSLRMEQGTLYRLDNLARGSSEYRDLKELRRPFKSTFYFFLALIALIITLGAMWVGFRLSKQLTQPLQALMEGTERIAKGDLSIRFDDRGTDEVALLIQSFNRMTDDLEQSARRIRASNEKLADRTQYIEAVLNSVAAGVISLDTDERISTVNKAACVIFELRPEDFIGKHPSELLRGKPAETVKILLEQVRRAPGLPQQRQLNITLRGRKWKLLISCTALVGTEGTFNGVVAIFEDITDLEKAQRMAAWREVARRIAHEIKNPLTPIKLSAQRLERKFGQEVNNPTFSQCTELIVSQVEKLQQMVEEFSSFAKLPEVSPKTGSLGPLLEELTLFFATSHSKIAWELTLDPNLPNIEMDQNALHRAIMNILTNAVEALEETSAPAVKIKASYRPEQSMVQIEIEDNGAGLSPEELDRLFEPYFSHKKDGTGLGLAIVKSIVSDHHGYVRAKNNPAGGAIISIELPVDES